MTTIHLTPFLVSKFDFYLKLWYNIGNPQRGKIKKDRRKKMSDNTTYDFIAQNDEIRLEKERKGREEAERWLLKQLNAAARRQRRGNLLNERSLEQIYRMSGRRIDILDDSEKQRRFLVLSEGKKWNKIPSYAYQVAQEKGFKIIHGPDYYWALVQEIS